MKDKRFAFGVIASALWIGIAAYFYFTKKHPGELNGWGDYFAGFSAPLAFLWLVLGYLQQGEELRNNTKALELQAEELKQSTDALRLQAEELKNSVEQQSQLVAVSREQMRMNIESMQEDREHRRELARPKFVADTSGAIESSGVKRHQLRFTNVGPIATDVSFQVSPDGTSPKGHFASFGSNNEFKAGITYATDADYEVRITYVDADRVPGEVIFPLAVTRSRVHIGKSRRIA